jgi:hypothetical protein
MGNRWKNYIKPSKICEECGKIFYVKPCRKYKARFCSYDCYWKWLKRNTLRGENSPFWKPKIFKFCKECKNKFEVTTAFDYRKFCSRKCFIEWQKKHPHGFIKNHWSKNPELKERVIEKMRQSLKGRNAWNKGKELPVEYKEKLSQIHKQMVEEGKQKNLFKVGFDSRRIKTQFNNNPEQRKKAIKSLIKRPNKKEKLLYSILQSNFPNEWKYIGNGKILIGRFNPDFINCNGKKKIIELFGDYWHKNDNSNDRIEYYKKYGFSTLIIWEKELENIENVVNKIKVFNNE